MKIGKFEQLKKCCMCKLQKDRMQFSKDKSRWDGTNPICKLCQVIRHKKYYAEYLKKETYQRSHREGVYRWIEKNKQKAKAHALANSHKSTIKKDTCERCGSSGKLHMHHPDYSKPLEVITLCNKCHVNAHHYIV